MSPPYYFLTLGARKMIITISLSKGSAELMRAAQKETNRTAADLATWSVQKALMDHYQGRPEYHQMLEQEKPLLLPPV